MALLETTAPALNFGRIDVAGPDGAWFGDKVSPAGKDALKSMEAASIVVNLVRPSAATLGDMLDNAKKPIMVTGLPAMDAALLDKFKKNNALAVVDCDAADVDGCVRQLNAAKDVVGKANVLLSVGPAKDRAAATQKLFLTLLKGGWTKAELDAATGAGGGRGGPGPGAANALSRFQAAPAGGRGM